MIAGKIIHFLFQIKRSSYLFNSSIAGIDQSDLCILVGSDIRKEAPIIGARLRKKTLDKSINYKVIRVGYQYDLPFNTTELGQSFSSLLNLQQSKKSRIYLIKQLNLFL